MTTFTESIVEEALAGLGRLGWAVLHGPEIAAGTAAAERSDPGLEQAEVLSELWEVA